MNNNGVDTIRAEYEAMRQSKAVQAAVLAERERCAKIADEAGKFHSGHIYGVQGLTAAGMATFIEGRIRSGK